MKEKRDEEQLLQELLEVVSLRNNIVDSIEVDRLRLATLDIYCTLGETNDAARLSVHALSPSFHLPHRRFHSLLSSLPSAMLTVSVCTRT